MFWKRLLEESKKKLQNGAGTQSRKGMATDKQAALNVNDSDTQSDNTDPMDE